MVTQQILPVEGRQKAIVHLFKGEGGFGYAAIGYASADSNLNDDSSSVYGFKELLVTQVDGYQERPPLEIYDGNSEISIDNNGKVIVNFEVELDTETIVPKQGTNDQFVKISQIGICNNSESDSPDTDFLLIASFTEFLKTPDIAISFIIEIKM